ncbi:MAG: aspartate aminotransferase family protein, partial [Candidatus Sericytochromatia bacterium]
NPGAFPSLRKFETEVLAMAAGLLGDVEGVVGNMTSGGTDSILMVVKTARDYALSRNPELKDPTIVAPISAHPAFDKACQYFGLKIIHTPVRDDFRADVAAFEAAITPNTVLCVGSSPSYPQGVVDPIAEMAAIAQKRDILFHVDACVGGFMLPFVRKLGYEVPAFDFTVPGVTSMSADLHKYGYAAKGASVVLYRNSELRRHQFFVYTEWPGGIYPSPTMVGTRPGGSIAAAWAVMNFLGEEGYLRIAREVMETTRKVMRAVDEIEGIKVLGKPEMSIFAIGSDDLDVYAVGDEMSLTGWHMDRQHYPPSLHVTMNHGHVQSHELFIRDLEAAVKKARRLNWSAVSSKVTVGLVKGLSKVLPEKVFSKLLSAGSAKGGKVPKRTSAMYGMIGSLPNRGDVEDMVLDFMDQTYRLEETGKE